MNQISSWLRGNHMLLMIIGCGLPLVALAAIYVFNIPLGTIGLFAIMLLCPLIHLFMMRGMGHGDQQASCHGEKQADTSAGKAETGLQLAGNRKEQ